jgi:hypothetical protein
MNEEEEDFCVVVGIFFSNFVGSESGQIKSVKLLQNMGLQHDSSPSPPGPPHRRGVGRK